jgi:hypothetical protein
MKKLAALAILAVVLALLTPMAMAQTFVSPVSPVVATRTFDVIMVQPSWSPIGSSPLPGPTPLPTLPKQAHVVEQAQGTEAQLTIPQAWPAGEWSAGCIRKAR